MRPSKAIRMTALSFAYRATTKCQLLINSYKQTKQSSAQLSSSDRRKTQRIARSLWVKSQSTCFLCCSSKKRSRFEEYQEQYAPKAPLQSGLNAFYALWVRSLLLVKQSSTQSSALKRIAPIAPRSPERCLNTKKTSTTPWKKPARLDANMIGLLPCRERFWVGVLTRSLLSEQ